jgi:hypothetical protein
LSFSLVKLFPIVSDSNQYKGRFNRWDSDEKAPVQIEADAAHRISFLLPFILCDEDSSKSTTHVFISRSIY